MPIDAEFQASSCDGKERFADRAAADRVAKKRSARWRRNRRIGLHAYRCRFCSGWHLGASEPYEMTPRAAKVHRELVRREKVPVA